MAARVRIQYFIDVLSHVLLLLQAHAAFVGAASL
jgi:hypothetical protein